MTGVLGTELNRPDAVAKATGRARYTEDIRPDGLLHCAVVRSPLASARIRSVDTVAALSAPGVVRVLTADDLPDRRWGGVLHDQPVLAREVTRFAGEPVALVVAEGKANADRAAALVGLDLVPLPAAVTLTDALRADAWQVHAGQPNPLPPSRIRRGDVDASLRDAAFTVTTRIESHRVHQAYLEPRATLAELDPDGGLVVTTTSQDPFTVRKGLAALLDRPMSEITVRVPALGGGFGGKLHLGLAPLAAVAALATGRPVRVVCSREEDLRAGNPRENSMVELTSAVDADGRLLARRATVYLDSGAYAFDTPTIASIAALLGTGPYRIDAVDLSAAAVATNTCPTGSFRGPSGPQLVYAVEAHMDEIAAAVGLDPVEVRRRNLLRSGDRGPNGELIPDVSIAECLDIASTRLARWRSDAPPLPEGRRRGYGLACAWWVTSGSPASATVTMNEDGTATVATGGTEIGTGAVVVGVAAVVADELGIPLSQVTVRSGGTDAPYDAGSKGSRTLYGIGNAAVSAAREVARQLREEAAERLEAAPDDLILTDGRVEVRGLPDSAIPLAEIATGALNRTGPLVGSGRFKAARAPLAGSTLDGMRFDVFNEATFHCHAAEIELDPETGRIEVLRYLAVHDIGTVLNPEGARGQVEGGVVQGLGYALSEVLDVAADGTVRNADLVDYRLPTVADIPRDIETVFLPGHPGPSGPHGAKGVGEAPVIVPAAAVGAALRDILGALPGALPLDPIRVAAFLDHLEKGSAR
ncbi:xanthine dehydrogenase family protein molybdopterin-binding subunit [Pseudonocardia acaciae]|uniref:xanthine dehydrogenase family protein molybdopterin-binding subunit n=1 Tax=Pseudonocardia acaciae TaxID=551276 RepID=UPI000490DB7D|nr:xanthine dehydrogenase family protein molybdopterin-binding subunit [Pseudonocardia acaciae]